MPLNMSSSGMKGRISGSVDGVDPAGLARSEGMGICLIGYQTTSARQSQCSKCDAFGTTRNFAVISVTRTPLYAIASTFA
jgi:hypothetical protein